MAHPRKKTLFSTLVGLAVFIEIFSVLPKHADLSKTKKIPSKNILKGAIHVHSIYSDGGGTAESIAQAGNEAKLDFIVLTDHISSEARQKGKEKRYENTDLFVEFEANAIPGHLVAFFSHTPLISKSDGEVNALAWQHFLGNDTSPGFFVAVAHPSNIKNPWSRYDKLADGIEVINFDSSWQRQIAESTLSFAGTVLIYPFNPFLSALRFIEVYPKDFVTWDNMNALSPGHFGYLAHDTHAKIPLSKTYALDWPDYKTMFRLSQNVVFLDKEASSDFNERKKQVYQAIQKNRLAMVMSGIFPFEGNDLNATCGEKSVGVGDTINFPSRCSLNVELPEDFPYSARLRVIKNGELYKEVPRAALQETISIDAPGTYRVEIWLNEHTLFHAALHHNAPYIFYNPIYVK